jgi:hypothetical protein
LPSANVPLGLFNGFNVQKLFVGLSGTISCVEKAIVTP